MLHNLYKRKSDQQGFTIIEVMIVLAIAGLILLIVFLAVPALQRNSRNTTMKNDASAFGGAFTEYASNNDGKQPTTVTQNGSVVTLSGGSGTNEAEAKVNGSTTVTAAKVTAAPTTYTPGTLYWRTGVTCAGGTSARAVVVYYWTETTGSSHTVSCVDAS